MTDFPKLQDAIEHGDEDEKVHVDGPDYFEATRTDVKWTLDREGETMVWGAGGVYVDLPPDEGLTFRSRDIPFDASIRPPNVHLLELAPRERFAETMDDTRHEPVGVTKGAAWNKMATHVSDLRATEVGLSGNANIIEAAYGLGSMYGFDHSEDGERERCPNCGGSGGIQNSGVGAVCPTCDGDGTIEP